MRRFIRMLAIWFYGTTKSETMREIARLEERRAERERKRQEAERRARRRVAKLEERLYRGSQ